MPDLLTERSARVAGARKLTRRSGRDDAGAFLAEGRQAVSEALAQAQAQPGAVLELFVTAAAADTHRDLLAAARVPVHVATDRAVASLSETVTPQGLVAVCALRDVPAATLVTDPPRLAVALAELNDPGNAGTVLRTADACGARTVVFGTGSADPYGGKVVRSSAGSLFHVDVVRSTPLAELVPQVQAAGTTVLAADGGGEVALDAAGDAGLLSGSVLWLFGNEARGLDAGLAALADARVRIPMRGRAESLNLSVAASICLYATQLAE
ncbi:MULTISPECIES: TrmH family RNA methyltransferase [unclassified Modestobacter]|uniref:TrmH family RNA methyltransferase n=1 Tax=unclassified Modestobacter TaxID=2643866 RepID=UPI0022AAB90E|nr:MULTISPECIES: RNA methyltransferase [unclassified Modestobacter]MCZ2825060.1 RNA methyltransferase [Modestobacter sp. VKM Ac-2981]MCZ2854437.1 RNA methyltransferase [Modestobacter sp. VKM Ac-2982]